MALELQGSETFPVKDTDLIANGDPDVTYTLRYVSVQKTREIVKANTRKGNFRRPEVVDWAKVQDDQCDYALVNWSGVMANGQPVPCQRQYKLGDGESVRGLDATRRAAIVDIATDGASVKSEDGKADSFRTA